MAGDYSPTAQDHELANEVALIIREDRWDFHLAAARVLNKYQLSGDERRERLANIGHILGLRQKPRLGKITDEVSVLMHQGYSFVSALRRVLSDYNRLYLRSFYASRVGKELAKRKEKQEARAAKQAARDAKKSARKTAQALKGAKKCPAKSKKKGVAPLLPQIRPGMTTEEQACVAYERKRMFGEALFLSHQRRDDLLGD